MAKTTTYYMNQKIKQNNRCPDCNVLIAPYKKRCQSCNAKKRWRDGTLKPHPNSRKVGRVRHSGGYIMLWMPEDTRTKNGYMLEHTIVWERHHGKPLPKGWVIHHLNGIRDDNRLVNLVGLPDRKHRRILAEKAKRIQMLEAILGRQGFLI